MSGRSWDILGAHEYCLGRLNKAPNLETSFYFHIIESESENEFTKRNLIVIKDVFIVHRGVR